MGNTIARNRDDDPLDHPLPLPSEALSPSLSISFNPSQSYFPLSPSSPTEILAYLVLDSPIRPSSSRKGVDLVFVLDVSSSMEGEKLELVQKTLLFTLTQLTSSDRVSLVTFSTKAERLCRLTRMDAAGKRLVALGMTDMVAGLEFSLFVVAGRRHCNAACAIIMLSDGNYSQFGDPIWLCKELVEKIQIEEEYTIHTFGYGSDHDPMLMNSIAEMKNGGFYYIERLESIAEAFANCLGEVFSIVADKIQVDLETQPCAVPFAVSKVYSETGDNAFRMPSLLCGSKKEAIFLMSIGPGEIESEEVLISPVKAVVSYRDTIANAKVVTEVWLQVRLCNNCSEAIIVDRDCLVNWYRVKTAEALKEAGEIGAKGDLEQARELLQRNAREIKESQIKDSNLAKIFVKDLEETSDKFMNEYQFRSEGIAEVIHKSRGHWSKRGQDVQEYQNVCQTEMIVESKEYFSKNSSSLEKFGD